MSTVEYVDLEAEHSVHFVQVQCTMCNETCPPWKDRSQAINVPLQMHQQQTKGRKYGANVLLGIWQQQRDQVL